MQQPAVVAYPARAASASVPAVWGSDSAVAPPAIAPVILPHPFAVCMIGERSTGKNTAICRILNTPLMTRRPDMVYLIRSVHKPLHDAAICGYNNTVWDFEHANFGAVGFRSLVILDGVYYEAVRSREFRVLMQRAQRDEISVIITTPVWFSNNMFAPIIKTHLTFVFRFKSCFRPDQNGFDDILDLQRHWRAVQRWNATAFGVLVVDLRPAPPPGWPRLYVCVFAPY